MVSAWSVFMLPRARLVRKLLMSMMKSSKIVTIMAPPTARVAKRSLSGVVGWGGGMIFIESRLRMVPTTSTSITMMMMEIIAQRFSVRSATSAP